MIYARFYFNEDQLDEYVKFIDSVTGRSFTVSLVADSGFTPESLLDDAREYCRQQVVGIKQQQLHTDSSQATKRLQDELEEWRDIRLMLNQMDDFPFVMGDQEIDLDYLREGNGEIH